MFNNHSDLDMPNMKMKRAKNSLGLSMTPKRYAPLESIHQHGNNMQLLGQSNILLNPSSKGGHNTLNNILPYASMKNQHQHGLTSRY